MPRPIPHRRLPLTLLLLGATAAFGLAAGSPRALAQAAAGSQPSAAMAEEAARAAANRILTAVRDRDGNAYFALLSPAAQRVSSPSMAAAALRGMPQVLSWKIVSIEPGVESSSVSTQLQTSAGPREVLVIVDGEGRMRGYHVNLRDQAAEDVVRQFIEALAQGRFVAASSFLSPQLEEEISQPALQKKWLNLQMFTGNYQGIRKIWQASSNNLMKLVIVTTRFNRLTDNLFVTLDTKNRIVSVDFPQDPNPPRAATP